MPKHLYVAGLSSPNLYKSLMALSFPLKVSWKGNVGNDGTLPQSFARLHVKDVHYTSLRYSGQIFPVHTKCCISSEGVLRQRMHPIEL